MKKPTKLCRLCNHTKRLRGRRLCYNCIRKIEKEKKLSRLKLKRERKFKTKKYQKSELKKWHAKVWEAQKQFLRRKQVNFQGYIECFCCGKMIPEKETEQMHRYHGKLDFDERNIHLGCARCNKYLNGNLGIYERKLIIELGLEGARQLEKDAAQDKGYTLEQLKQLFITYTI